MTPREELESLRSQYGGTATAEPPAPSPRAELTALRKRFSEQSQSPRAELDSLRARFAAPAAQSPRAELMTLRKQFAPQGVLPEDTAKPQGTLGKYASKALSILGPWISHLPELTKEKVYPGGAGGKGAWLRGEWDRGALQVGHGYAGWDMMLLGETPEKWKRAHEIADEMNQKPRAPEWDWANPWQSAQNVLGTAVGMAPYMVESIGKGLAGRAIGTVVAPTAAATAGVAVPAPEEVVTVPGGAITGGIVGEKIGQIYNGAAVEGGEIFMGLREQGVDPTAARTAALAGGVLMGALDTIGIGIITKRLPGFRQKAVQAVLRQPTLRKYLQRAAGYIAKDTASEIAVEEAQQTISLASRAGAYLAKSLKEDKDYAGPDAQQAVAELRDTLVQSAKGFPLLVGLGAHSQTMADIAAGRQAPPTAPAPIPGVPAPAPAPVTPLVQRAAERVKKRAVEHGLDETKAAKVVATYLVKEGVDKATAEQVAAESRPPTAQEAAVEARPTAPAATTVIAPPAAATPGKPAIPTAPTAEATQVPQEPVRAPEVPVNPAQTAPASKPEGRQAWEMTPQEINNQTWYHGTPSAFESFDPNKARDGLVGTGFYFTDSPKVASAYAKKGIPQHPNVRVVQPNVKNPFYYDVTGKTDYPESVKQEALGVLYETTSQSMLRQDWRLLKEKLDNGANPMRWILGNDVQTLALRLGHDSVVYNGGQLTGGEPHTVLLVFDKSNLREGFAAALAKMGAGEGAQAAPEGPGLRQPSAIPAEAPVAKPAPQPVIDAAVAASEGKKGKFARAAVVAVGKKNGVADLKKFVTDVGFARDIRAQGEALEGMGVPEPPAGVADVGGYAVAEPPVVTQAGAGQARAWAVWMPELIEFARTLSGAVPSVSRKLDVAARFNETTGGVTVRADVARNPREAAYVLSHEIIGHLWDWLPEGTLSRGNILGRIAALQRYAKSLLDPAPVSQTAVLTAEERRGIQAKALQEVLQERSVTFKDYAFGGDKALRKSIDKDRQARYRTLLGAEVKSRGLIDKKTVMAELQALSLRIKPFDPGADPSITKYRFSSRELFADAMAAMAQDPSLLQEMAPTFYKALLAHMESRPDVKETWQEIQQRTGAPEELLARRNQAFEEMLARGEAAQRAVADRDAHRFSAGEAALELEEGLIDNYARLIAVEREAAKKGINIGTRASTLWQEMAYTPAAVHLMMREFVQDVWPIVTDAGIKPEVTARYQILKRIVSGDRSKFFNPYPFTDAATAREHLAAMEAELGPEKMAVLNRYADAFAEWWNSHVLSAIEASGISTPEAVARMRSNKWYVTFLVQKYIDDQDGALHRQDGTFYDIANPIPATIQKGALILKHVARQAALRQSIQELVAVRGPEAALPAERAKATGFFDEKAAPPGRALVMYLDKGVWQGVYIDEKIAREFQRNAILSSHSMRLWQTISSFFKNVFVRYNPGWLTFNPFRDFFGTYMRLPGVKMRNLLAQVIKSVPDAYRDIFQDIVTPTVEEMYRGRMLLVGRAYSPDVDVETALDRELTAYGFTPEAAAKNANIFARLLAWVDRVGQFEEHLTKIAGYKELKRLQAKGRLAHLGEKEIAHLVRTRAGTPDVLRRGRWSIIYNNAWMFSNVIKEGYRGHLEMAKEAPAEYAMKHLVLAVAPKAVLFLAAAGFMGDEYRKIIEGVSEYDKTNYTIIPLGLTADGKSVYLRLPQDDMPRVVGGVLWKLLNLAWSKVKDEPMPGASLGEAAALVGEQAPGGSGLHPVIQTAFDIWNYVKGQNPYDDFYQRPMLDPTVYAAGGMRSHTEFAKQIANRMGFRSLYVFRGNTPERVADEYSKIVGVPVAGPVVYRWLRVGDYGRKEIGKAVEKDVESRRAQRTLDLQDAITDAINAKARAGQRPTNADAVPVYAKARQEGWIAPTVSIKQFLHTWNRYATRSTDNAAVNAVASARTNEAKAEIMAIYHKRMDASEWSVFTKTLLLEGHIGVDVLEKLTLAERSAAQTP